MALPETLITFHQQFSSNNNNNNDNYYYYYLRCYSQTTFENFEQYGFAKVFILKRVTIVEKFLRNSKLLFKNGFLIIMYREFLEG